MDELAAVREEFADAFTERTALVICADGFMGSHLTEVLVELGADVHAFEPVVLRGDGSPTREFLYGEDCAGWVRLAGERYDGAT